MTYEDFERQLFATLVDPGHWKGQHQYQPFTDTTEELSGWYGYSEEFRAKRARLGTIEEDDDEDGESLFDAPYIAANPYRDVGRNDPCPCGSRKKFKKCCLA